MKKKLKHNFHWKKLLFFNISKNIQIQRKIPFMIKKSDQILL